jgi:hypothetical protein
MTTPINQDIEDILDDVLIGMYCMDSDGNFVRLDDKYNILRQEARDKLKQRETALLTYIASLYGLPLKELQRTVELWRKK